MTHYNFEGSEWVERLGQALEVLAETVTATRINCPELTNDQYRSLAEFAKQDEQAQNIFENYFPKLNSDPTEVIELLRAHPILHRDLGGEGAKAAVMMVMPQKGFRVELDRLAWFLARSTIKRGGQSAANILHKYLTLSDEKLLPGYEITLFRGLELDKRVEIGKGAFITSYDEVVRLGWIKEPKEEPPFADTHDFRKEGALAFVREITWGPGITPPMTGSASLRDIKHRPEVRFSCLAHEESLGIVFDFLSIVTRHRVDILSVQICAAKFMKEIDSNFGSNSSTWVMGVGARSKKKFSAQEQIVFRELLNNWEKFKQNRNIPDLAIRRLASSLSRIGRFGLQDSILDVSIALEIMYQLESTELNYKLATRAGYYLGTNAEERKSIFDKVKSFYKIRSDIIHGRKTSTEKVKTLFDDGFDLARDTLFKLLGTGLPSNWDNIVMLGPIL